MRTAIVLIAAMQATPALAGPVIYQLSVEGHCAYTLAVNGYPLDTGKGGSWSGPVNPFLVGAGNRIAVEGKGDACSLRAVVTRVDQASGDQAEAAAGTLEKAGKLTLAFDATTPGVLAPYRQAPPFQDEKAVRAYGVRLVELARAGNHAAWKVEVAPKVADWARAFEAPLAAIESSERESFGRWKGKATRADASRLVLEPILEGRLWRIRLGAGTAALLVSSDGDTEEITVARVGGALRVVR